MLDFLDSLDDEFTAEYFAGFERCLESLRLPLKLDAFMDLESRYYADWQRKRARSHHKSGNGNLAANA